MFLFLRKKGKEDRFETLFKEAFHDHFILYSKADFLKSGYLGSGQAHMKVDDYVGDFIAVATSDKMIKYQTMNLKSSHHFLAHHAGMSHEEMLVPLIIIHSPAV